MLLSRNTIVCAALVLVTVSATLAPSRPASAGIIAVVADVNAAGSANFSFYDAVLGSGQSVLFSRDVGQQANVSNHYGSLAGVSTVSSSATLTDALLTAYDLLVLTVNFSASAVYTNAETTAISNFVSGSGSVLVILESVTPEADGYNSILSRIGSSIRYSGDRFTVSESGIAAESTSLGALDPFNVNHYNTLTGGTPVYVSSNGTVVAFDGGSATVSEPGVLLLLGTGISLLVTRRRRS